MALREKDNPELFARVEEQNLLRQYDLLTNCIEIGLEKGIDAFDKYTLWTLNYAGIANVCQLGGRYREGPIYVGSHIPPHFESVSRHVDQLISLIQENWETIDSPVTLAAYALWRLNWIHPFIEGNGRTARAACYYLLCVKAGRLLPGKKIVPERIRENRIEYYAALQDADTAWSNGQFDVTSLDRYLTGLLSQQLEDA
ncbi:MAG: Fic family protein [Paracoccaceae bacterium]